MGRSAAQARAVRGRSGAQRNAGREPWPQRAQARRSDRKGAEFLARGCSRSALCRNGRRRQRGTAPSGGAMPAASVQAFQPRLVGPVRPELGKRPP